MPLTEEQRKTVADFRDWIEAAVRRDAHFQNMERADREDESTLATRWQSGTNLWYEVTVRPFLPQARVGVMTDDRWLSEELEQKIEDSGDTMQEFVEMGLEAAGLSWLDPPVEHYRDQGKYFYFATPLDLRSIDGLADGAIREKILHMLEGYRLAFSGEAHR